MLLIKDLKKKYKRFQVLDGLNMTINKGDVYGFIGRNGCGKTTTMSIICNIIPKDGGELVFGKGKETKIGYLPEAPLLFGYMNGREYLDYIAACCEYDGDVNKRTAEVLEIVKMTDSSRRKIKGYSRGMNQRLGIAAAIYNSPDILILDEPTSALDPEGRMSVMSIISHLASLGTTIILCTHILSDIEKVSNRIGILSNGKLAFEGGIDDILNQFASELSFTVKLFQNVPEKIQILRTAPFVHDSLIDSTNGEIKLFAKPEITPEQFSVSVLDIISQNQIPIDYFKRNRYNLDDVYMSIIGKGELKR